MTDSANAGELVTLALKHGGVSHLFTLNGGHIWPILTGATEHSIRIIDVRHEQSAAFAAEGWAKVTRQVGVAAVTAGPGVTNAASAIAQAQAADSPLFVIGGRAPNARWGMGSLQEMDHVAFLQTLTKQAQTLGSAEEAYRLAAESMRASLSGRTGPVFMDVPLDVFFGAADMPEATEHLTADPGASPDPDLIQRAAQLIREAQRPSVIAGGTVWWSHAENELKALAEGPTFLYLSTGWPAACCLRATRSSFLVRAAPPWAKPTSSSSSESHWISASTGGSRRCSPMTPGWSSSTLTDTASTGLRRSPSMAT